MNIRVRIAPSPTGLLHIGTVRTALSNYLFAKKNKGTFILRIEDTDKERSFPEYEANILSGLKNLGLTPDEGPENPGKYGPYRQSERTHIYRPYIEKLLEEGKAYHCFCTQQELEKERENAQKNKIAFRYSGKCRNISLKEAMERREKGEKSVIRMIVPENKDISFTDIIRGKTKQNTKDLTGDMVIAKDLSTPLYNFVVVIDDHLMEISHVIRGEDHLSNTPKQILIYEVFGWDIPQFAHLPLILNEDRSKLSKRKNSVSVDDYISNGYLKEALINFLILLGWNDGTEKEIYSLEELEKCFSLERVGKAGAVFDIKRLNWINQQYIKMMTDRKLAQEVFPLLIKENRISKIFEADDPFAFEIVNTKEQYHIDDLANWVRHEKERINRVTELVEALDFYFVHIPEYDKDLLLHKGKIEKKVALFALEEVLNIFEKTEDFSEENIKTILIEKIAEWGLSNGEVLWPIRAALTGKERSPGAFEMATTLGKEKSIQRIEEGIKKLQEK